MDIRMNQHAVIWFLKRVFPMIQHQVPDIQFWIVGRNPPPHIRALDDEKSIIVTGTVSDVRDYYAQADVFIIPSRMGGGTKLKTLEAMAIGLPIVSTSIGAQGLNIQSGHHLYIEDSPNKFAKGVIALLQNDEKARAIGEEARAFVQKHHDWETIVSHVANKLQPLVTDRFMNSNYSASLAVAGLQTVPGSVGDRPEPE